MAAITPYYDAILKTLHESKSSTAIQQQAYTLAAGYIERFHVADQSFKIIAAESELYLEIAPPPLQTILIGRGDLLAEREDYKAFFGEWKTANPRKKKTWRQGWRMSPQALTYGLIYNRGYLWQDGQLTKPSVRPQNFLVRQAFKSAVPDYDYEWFAYDQRELMWWEQQVRDIGDEIRAYRSRGKSPWQPNITYCDKYGKDYICPFWEGNCSKMLHGAPTGLQQRVSHLEVEKWLQPRVSEHAVILDATRIVEYLNCKEKYRQQYQEGWVQLPSEALELGSLFHSLLDVYYGILKTNKVGGIYGNTGTGNIASPSTVLAG